MAKRGRPPKDPNGPKTISREVWDFDDIGIVYVTDVDGNDLNLTAAEEAEIADIIRKEHTKNDYIDSLVWAGHDEYAYYNYRRR